MKNIFYQKNKKNWTVFVIYDRISNFSSKFERNLKFFLKKIHLNLDLKFSSVLNTFVCLVRCDLTCLVKFWRNSQESSSLNFPTNFSRRILAADAWEHARRFHERASRIVKLRVCMRYLTRGALVVTRG